MEVRMMVQENVDFMNLLCAEVPMTREVFTEHLDEYDGELVPHLLMADLTRWAEDSTRAGGDVRPFIYFLSQQLGPAVGNVRDLILASFIEQLEPHSPLLRLLPDNLRRARSAWLGIE